MMKKLLELLKQRLAKEEVRKYLHFLAIPLVVILLMIVIVIADKTEQGNTKETVTQAETKGNAVSEESEGSTGKEETTAASVPKLAKEEISEIHELMQTYFKAKKSCDGDTLSQVYGGTCSPEQLQRRLQRIEEEVKYYQDFQNLICYTVKGLADNSWVVYARFDMKLRQAETIAPTMVACYAKQAEDGSYYLEGETTAEEAAYMKKMNESEDVQLLARDVNANLRSALESDSNLLSVYYDLTGHKDKESAAETSAETSEALQ